ncbi:MAG: hypothetical protein K0R01_1116 [Mycobacterium sp.]|nr:hypothetical protein [Mycobacterium sp.]
MPLVWELPTQVCVVGVDMVLIRGSKPMSSKEIPW